MYRWCYLRFLSPFIVIVPILAFPLIVRYKTNYHSVFLKKNYFLLVSLKDLEYENLLDIIF